MVTEDVILTEIYKLLNVTSVTTAIDGKIYKGEKPVNRQLQDIVIGLLTNTKGTLDKIQTGIININIFCKESVYHLRNNTKLNEITASVINALLLFEGQNDIAAFHIVLDSQKVFRDNDDLEMFYNNIRLDFSYKN